jgi:hypothetical protein
MSVFFELIELANPQKAFASVRAFLWNIRNGGAKLPLG